MTRRNRVNPLDENSPPTGLSWGPDWKCIKCDRPGETLLNGVCSSCRKNKEQAP